MDQSTMASKANFIKTLIDNSRHNIKKQIKRKELLHRIIDEQNSANTSTFKEKSLNIYDSSKQGGNTDS